jgi:hypothetical protein
MVLLLSLVGAGDLIPAAWLAATGPRQGHPTAISFFCVQACNLEARAAGTTASPQIGRAYSACELGGTRQQSAGEQLLIRLVFW